MFYINERFLSALGQKSGKRFISVSGLIFNRVLRLQTGHSSHIVLFAIAEPAPGMPKFNLFRTAGTCKKAGDSENDENSSEKYGQVAQPTPLFRCERGSCRRIRRHRSARCAGKHVLMKAPEGTHQSADGRKEVKGSNAAECGKCGRCNTQCNGTGIGKLWGKGYAEQPDICQKPDTKRRKGKGQRAQDDSAGVQQNAKNPEGKIGHAQCGDCNRFFPALRRCRDCVVLRGDCAGIAEFCGNFLFRIAVGKAACEMFPVFIDDFGCIRNLFAV